MADHGMHHLGLATHPMEATLVFYAQVLGSATQVSGWRALARA